MRGHPFFVLFLVWPVWGGRIPTTVSPMRGLWFLVSKEVMD